MYETLKENIKGHEYRMDQVICSRNCIVSIAKENEITNSVNIVKERNNEEDIDECKENSINLDSDNDVFENFLNSCVPGKKKSMSLSDNLIRIMIVTL